MILVLFTDPCFSYDTDSPFNDIKPAPYASNGAFGTQSAHECQQLCQRVNDCKFFLFDTRFTKIDSIKCWLKTGKSFILPPTAGTILGPKHCDGYAPPEDTNIGNAYDVPVAKQNEPKDKYQEPESSYEEPDYKGE